MFKLILANYAGAAALAYLVLSFLGYAASTIYYLQVGLWYPNYAGTSDYFLASIQDFTAVLGLLTVAALSVIYYGIGAALSGVKFVMGRRIRKGMDNTTVRRLYEKLGSSFDRAISYYKASWKIFLPVGLVLAYVLFPWVEGRRLATEPETYTRLPNVAPLAVKIGETQSMVYLLGTTSDYVIALDETRSKLTIYRRDSISLAEREVR